jgi:glycosyltransferase involved in cell wall biosynthesis
VGQFALSAGFPFVDLDTRTDALWHNGLAIRRCVPGLTGCRVVHAWHSRGLELAWWLGHRLGVPVTATLHDHPRALHSLPRRLLIRFFQGRMDHVIFVSRALQAAWEPCTRPSRNGVITNGIMDFRVNRSPSGPVRIGFVGLHSPVKGFPVVRRWIGELKEEQVEWFLFGNPHRAIESSLRELVGSYSKVRWCGYQPAERVFSGIDILVHPSTDFDSLPTALIEAACAGLPVVASDIGGTREIVNHGHSGFLYAPGEPDEGRMRVMELVRSPVLRAEMERVARRVFEEKFRVSRMVREYADTWTRIGNYSPHASEKAP